MFCGHCGSKMNEVDCFCATCGKEPLQDNQPNPEQQPAIHQEESALRPPPRVEQAYIESVPEEKPSPKETKTEKPSPKEPRAEKPPPKEPRAVQPSPKEPKAEELSPKEPKAEKSKKKKVGILLGIGIALAIIIGLILFLLLRTSVDQDPDLLDSTEEAAIEKIEEEEPAIQVAPLLEVPTFYGLILDEAIDLLEASGFVLGVVHEAYDDTTDAGVVISQSILAGERVEEGEVIDLLVSLGPEMATVPDFIGLEEESARELIESSNLRLGNITYEYDEDVEEGHVIGQSIETGDTVDPGTSIDLTVSLGAPTEPLGPYDLDVWGTEHMATLELDGVTVDVPIPPWLDADQNLLFCEDGCCLFILERESDTLMTMVEVMLTPLDENEDFQEVAESMVEAVESFLMGDNYDAVATIYFQTETELTAGIHILEYSQDGSDELISIFELVRIKEYEGIIIRTRLRLRTVDAPETMSSDEFAYAYRLWRYVAAGHFVMDN